MEGRYWEFVQYLWDVRHPDFLFRPSTLTEDSREEGSTLPSPALTYLEATALYDFLEGKGLVTEKEVIREEDGKKETVYRINKIEADKWKDVVRELRKSPWRRSWLYKKTRDSLFYIVGLVLAAWVGAYFNKVGESSYETRMFHRLKELRADIPTENDKPAPPNEVTSNPDNGTDNRVVPAEAPQ